MAKLFLCGRAAAAASIVYYPQTSVGLQPPLGPQHQLQTVKAANNATITAVVLYDNLE